MLGDLNLKRYIILTANTALYLLPKQRKLFILTSYVSVTFAYQFEGTEIALDGRMGIFVTMNPGYAGRTELPESVKALFRPVMCIVPDLQQICEIMLFSEGFLLAKVKDEMVLHRK